MVIITRATMSSSRSEGSRPSESDIHNWIETAVSAAVREMTPEMFGTTMTELIALFYEWYVVVASTIVTIATTVVVVVTPSREKETPYRDFNNNKPPKFDGVKDPIIVMRWISNMEGYF